MANQDTKDIILPRFLVKEKKGLVIFDLEKYQDIEKKLEEYRKKEQLLRSLRNFEDLAKWGRIFARKKRITQKQIFEND